MEISEANNENSILDFLLVFAQNIKLLVLGPLIASLFALIVSYQIPKNFISQAILVLPTPTPTPTQTQTPIPISIPTPAQAASMMTSPVVLDLVEDSLGLPKGKASDIARNGVASQISATVGKDGLLYLQVTALTPREAHALANAVIDVWLKTTIPTELERRDLEKRLAYAENGLKGVTTLMEKLSAEGSTRSGRGDVSVGLIPLSELQARYLTDVLSTSKALQGITRDVVKQAPTLPTEPRPVKKGLISTITALATCFVLLLFVYIRQAWRAAKANPIAAQKQGQLLQALGFKPH